MTPADLRLARQRLGLSQRGLAEVLRMGKQGGRTVRSWELGEREVPGPVQVAVELMLECEERGRRVAKAFTGHGPRTGSSRAWWVKPATN